MSPDPGSTGSKLLVGPTRVDLSRLKTIERKEEDWGQTDAVSGYNGAVLHWLAECLTGTSVRLWL